MDEECLSGKMRLEFAGEDANSVKMQREGNSREMRNKGQSRQREERERRF